MTLRELFELIPSMTVFVESEHGGPISDDYKNYKDWEITYLEATGIEEIKVRLKRKEKP